MYWVYTLLIYTLLIMHSVTVYLSTLVNLERQTAKTSALMCLLEEGSTPSAGGFDGEGKPFSWVHKNTIVTTNHYSTQPTALMNKIVSFQDYTQAWQTGVFLVSYRVQHQVHKETM